MSDGFESARMKAMKLAALASAGVGGERENALRMLEAHLKRHGLTMAALGDDGRCERMLHCVVDMRHPTKDTGLLELAGQCLAYVLNKQKLRYRSRTLPIHVLGKKKSCFVVIADLTAAEHEDWVACFTHYAPDFVKTRKQLRDALRMAFKGFIHKHGIFPESDGEGDSKPLTIEQMIAMMAAMNMSTGEKWDRPAGRLEQGGFMLE